MKSNKSASELKPSLSKREAKRRADLEGVVLQGLANYREMGPALAEIDGNRLYRETHKTFGSYCKPTFGFSRSRAYQIIGDAKVINNLSTKVDKLPKSEREARPLTVLSAEDQVTVWLYVLKNAPNGVVTAKYVQQEVDSFLARNSSTDEGATAQGAAGRRTKKSKADGQADGEAEDQSDADEETDTYSEADAEDQEDADDETNADRQEGSDDESNAEDQEEGAEDPDAEEQDEASEEAGVHSLTPVEQEQVKADVKKLDTELKTAVSCVKRLQGLLGNIKTLEILAELLSDAQDLIAEHAAGWRTKPSRAQRKEVREPSTTASKSRRPQS